MIIQKILNKLLKYRDITRGGELYLRRYYLTPRSWPFHLFLHTIYKPDDDEHPHDHPWWFWGLVLSGGYFEAVYKLVGKKAVLDRYEHRYFGKVAYRGATSIHQIESLHSDKPCWTLILTGKAKQAWGFFDETGKVDWRTYQNRPNAQASIEDEPR